MNTVELGWHTICTSIEIDEMELRSIVKPMTASPRHELFLMIKHPDVEFYRGRWGPEILYVESIPGVKNSRYGRVHCTAQRHKQILDWLYENVWDI
jgi:hypothetical protein